MRDDTSGESSGAVASVPTGQRTEPETAVPQNAGTAPAVAKPPAAETVIAAEVTEETLRLRTELETERAARKKVESDHASVTDEFHRYKDATEARATPIPVRVKKASEPSSYRFLRRRD